MFVYESDYFPQCNITKIFRDCKQKREKNITKTRTREGGASVFTTLLSFFRISVPSSARKKFWPSNQAGEKEGSWGEGIFARLSCAVGAVGRKRGAKLINHFLFKKGSSFVQ